MMTPLIHCTESDSMSEKEFRASIELLGLIQQKDTNKYHIHFPTDNGYNFLVNPLQWEPYALSINNFNMY